MEKYNVFIYNFLGSALVSGLFNYIIPYSDGYQVKYKFICEGDMLMKERIKGFLSGVILTSLLSCSVVFAEEVSKTVDVVYNNIKIFIDGAEYVPKDANGNLVEPFVYNGTTYLPVRGIANAFQKDVVWDGANASIYLGKKGQNQPDNWLDRIQYSYYKSDVDHDNLYKINGKITDFSGADYTNGILLYRGYSGGFAAQLDYPLNMQYKTLKGKIVLPKKIDIAGVKNDDALNGDAQIDKVELWGDGRLLKTIPKVSVSMPMSFEIDVTGVAQLSIKVSRDKDWNSYYCALTDLALYK